MPKQKKPKWEGMSSEDFLALFKGHHITAAVPDAGGIPHHYTGFNRKELEKRNIAGRGIFFTVNLLDPSLDPVNPRTGKPRYRTKAMVVKARAVFMDDDSIYTEPRDEFDLAPSIIVETSRGKYHYYWLISSGGTKDLETWDKVQKGLIHRYDGDKGAKDLARILRIPGFKHMKNPNHPFEVRVVGGTLKGYSWDRLKEAFPPVDETVTINGEEIKAPDSDYQSDDELIRIIKTGSHGLHGAINKMLLGMKRDGMKKSTAVAIIQGMAPDRWRTDERLADRFDSSELVRSWDGVPEDHEEMKNMTLPDLLQASEEEYHNEIPWPPGLFGELATDAYQMARYQYKEVAIVSALGLVAGVCGRKFNFEDAGLNIYCTLIMSTGQGKDSIGRFINKALLQANDVGTGMQFIGPVRFTGPRAVYKTLQEKRTMVCVFTEAGLLLNSKAGDRDGLKRTILGLYNKGGQDSWSGSEQYSDEDKGIKALRAPALTIISESTPATLLEVFARSKSLDSGEVPRQFVLRVVGDKPAANRLCNTHEFTPKCMTKLKHLIGKCTQSLTKENPDAWILQADDDVMDDIIRFENYYVQIENTERNTNQTRSVMATRAPYKAMRLAGIAAAFNRSNLTIGWPEWTWAKQMIEYEMKGLEIFLRGGGMSDTLSDISMRIITPRIDDVLKERVKVRAGLSREYHAAGYFKTYELKQTIRNHPEVNTLDDPTSQRSTP